MDWGQQFSYWICVRCLVLVCFWFLPIAVLAGDVVVFGGTERQKRFVSCVAEVAANELRPLSTSDQPMTFVILDHQKFLQTRIAFHARKTRLAFSNLAIRRIYLSSRVFSDSDTASGPFTKSAASAQGSGNAEAIRRCSHFLASRRPTDRWPILAVFARVGLSFSPAALQSFE